MANNRAMPVANEVFRALADPTRREIVRLLRERPRPSGEIAEHFSTAWATISRHLAVLRAAKLIVAEKDGTSVIYELNATVMQELVAHILDWAGVGGTDAQMAARRVDRHHVRSVDADAAPSARRRDARSRALAPVRGRG
jgi:DNA-binding transcriptional ArsR family regulator